MLFWIKYETARTIGEDFFFSFVFFFAFRKGNRRRASFLCFFFHWGETLNRTSQIKQIKKQAGGFHSLCFFFPLSFLVCFLFFLFLEQQASGER